jgi:hypothetical protein
MWNISGNKPFYVPFFLKNPLFIIVYQYPGIITDTKMVGDIHPNEKGVYIMVEKWFKAVQLYLNKLK